MWFVSSTQHWLKEVSQVIIDNNLDIFKAKFAIVCFSSMDREFVRYFRSNYELINDYTGRNFHIFVPSVNKHERIDDEYWRNIKREFKRFGILHSNNPTIILFTIEQRENGDIQPNFYSELEFTNYNEFNNKFRDIVDYCLSENDTNVIREYFKQGNLLDNSTIDMYFKEHIIEFLSDIVPAKRNHDEYLLAQIINSLSELQGRIKSINNNENSRNNFVSSLLQQNKFIRVSEQPMVGLSETGQEFGHPDLLIENPASKQSSFCEFFNLETLDTNNILKHFNKIFGYDLSGNNLNFLIIYADNPDFVGLWEKYKKAIKNVDNNFKIEHSYEERVRYSEIKVLKTIHNRSENRAEIYHIFVNINHDKYVKTKKKKP